MLQSSPTPKQARQLPAVLRSGRWLDDGVDEAYDIVFSSDGSLAGVMYSVFCLSNSVGGGGIAIFSGSAPLATAPFIGCVGLASCTTSGCRLVGRLDVPAMEVAGFEVGACDTGRVDCWVAARESAMRSECVATRVASECKVATCSLRSLPSILPTPIALISPSSPASNQRTGAVRKYLSVSGPGAIVRQSRRAGSRLGMSPHSNFSFPPYFWGMSSMSMNWERVGSTW